MVGPNPPVSSLRSKIFQHLRVQRPCAVLIGILLGILVDAFQDGFHQTMLIFVWIFNLCFLVFMASV